MTIDPRINLGALTAGGVEAVPYEPTQPRALFDRAPEADDEALDKGEWERGAFWRSQVEAALVHERRWRQEAIQAEELYFGPDQDPGRGGADGKAARIDSVTSTIHGNIDVLKPLVFSDTPQPIVQRRWRGDGKADETDNMAAEAGQRFASYLVSTTDFELAIERVRDDWLIAGRGAARILYSATFAAVLAPDPLTGIEMPTGQQRKVSEDLRARTLEWPRFLVAPAPSWDAVPWIGFEVPMTRRKVERRFGPEKAARMGFNRAGLVNRMTAFGTDDRRQADLLGGGTDSGEPVPSPFDSATVWEIWDREGGADGKGQVVWWSPDYPGGILDEAPDPLGLEGFFPMPRPLLATTKGDSLVPRPDVHYYLADAREVELANQKMRAILEVISVSGLFPGSMADEVKRLLNGKNEMVPVQSWIALIEKGGSKDLIQWLPLEAMVKALQALGMIAEAAKGRLFESSGISDIMRAQGDPNETATAQQLKGRYAGMRLSVRQRKMAFYVRDLLRQMIEVGLELFDTERLAAICALDIPMTEAERQAIHQQHEQMMALYAQAAAAHQELAMAAEQHQAQGGQLPAPLPPPPQEPPKVKLPETSWELVHARLRDDFGRKVMLQIETDSTILADETDDREARIEFLSAFSAFVQQILPMTAAGWPMATIKELLLFGVRSFRNARTLESMIADLPDEPPGEGAPPLEMQLAQLKGEIDVQIQSMDDQQRELDRQQELKLKGMDVLVRTAEAGDPGHKSPDVPNPPPEKAKGK